MEEIKKYSEFVNEGNSERVIAHEIGDNLKEISDKLSFNFHVPSEVLDKLGLIMDLFIMYQKGERTISDSKLMELTKK